MPKRPPLSETHPELAAEAMFDPTTVVAGSHTKMPWKCAAHGHVWEASANSRTGANKTGCPVCSGNTVLAGFNDLQTTFPDIAREADFDATTVAAGSSKKMPWKCTAHGHAWEASANSRTGHGTRGCPVCSNYKVLVGFNDLQTTHPELVAEAMFDPTSIIAGSDKKMPWKCAAHGHEWKASVVGRTSAKKTGCPVCSNNKVLAGFNDLQTTFPDIAREADFDPTTVVAGSHTKMPWKCAAHGHVWEASANSRTRANKTGCPVCSGNTVLAGFNDLQTTFPDIAREADFDATTVAAGSSKKMPWKCTAHGHAWEASANSRTGAEKTGCPVCSNYKVLVGFNDLQTTHPELAAEAMFDPTSIIAGSDKKMPWKCTAHGHEWRASVANRTKKNGTGCPVCANQQVLAGFNDLQTTYPDVAREADFDATTVAAGNNTKMPWKCAAHGHVWEASANSRTGANKTGCPVCSGNTVLAGFNDLQTTHPELAKEADFDPTTVIAGSNKKMSWKCTAHGHAWEASANSRTGAEKTGCPVCSNYKVLVGFNDLQTTHPELAAEAMFDPTTVPAGSHSKMPWKCTAHGHRWSSVIKNRTGDKQGCPVCSNKKVLAGFNDLQTTHPELAKEADFDPTTVAAGSHSKMPWKCTDHGHQWSAVIKSRTGPEKPGCPVCAGQKVLAGFNDLQTTHPELAKEAQFDPTTVIAGTNKKMSWQCSVCGWHWRATGDTRVQGSGCPVCADYGFNPGDPAWLYLMRHPEWLLQQIGITNHIKDRLKKHESNGWEVLDVRGPMDGFLTQNWEASILRWLTSRSIARAASGTDESPHFDTPNSGEAWQQSDLTVTSVREIMDLVEADEQ